jgi:hypothetical protein
MRDQRGGDAPYRQHQSDRTGEQPQQDRQPAAQFDGDGEHPAVLHHRRGPRLHSLLGVLPARHVGARRVSTCSIGPGSNALRAARRGGRLRVEPISKPSLFASAKGVVPTPKKVVVFA